MQDKRRQMRNRKGKFKKNYKPRRFIANAKGFAKKGFYGRGTEIEEDQFTYFVNILDAMKMGFETMDEKATMANNVFEQTIDKEIHLSSNQVVSKAIEALIGFTDAPTFERFMNTFRKDFRPICSDKFASHILQKMVEIAFLRTVGNAESETQDEPTAKKPKRDLFPETEFNSQEFSEDHKQKCSEFVLNTGKFLLNNLEDFVWDPYANQIMRSTILNLAGIHIPKVAFEHGDNNIKDGTKHAVPEEWHEVVKEFGNRLQLWPQFFDLPYNDLSSGLLGSICIAFEAIDKTMLKHLGKKILVECFLKCDENNEKKEEKIEINDDDEEDNGKEDDGKEDDEKENDEKENDGKEDNENENDGKEDDGKEDDGKEDDGKEDDGKEDVDTKQENENNLPKVFKRGSSLRLLETLLSTAGRKLFTQIYAMVFIGKLHQLSANRKTNFAVQKLIEHVKEKTDFESIFTEIADHIEEILQVGHSGVVFALSKGCCRLQTKQGAFLLALQTALHTTGSKEKSDAFFICACKLKPYEVAIKDKTQFIHLHGSLIVQTILKFNKPIFLVNSILTVPPTKLIAIFSTAIGSYIADIFFESKFIGEKSREKLIRHLEGNYIDMAVTKFGSRVLEKLFEAGSDGQKAKIAKELLDKVNLLKGTLFGRVLFQKFRIETYRLSPAQWKTAFNKANKTEKLFKEIIT